MTTCTTRPPCDTRPAQAVRVADYLELHPSSTAKEIDAACDVGSMTKVISDMYCMGYDLHKGWRFVPCTSGHRPRKVRTYALTRRPPAQPDLFTLA